MRTTIVRSLMRTLFKSFGHYHALPAKALASIFVVAAPLLLANAAETAEKKLSYKEIRASVLAADPEVLKTIGAHMILGYHVPSQLKPYLKRGAIGGVFVTRHNVRKKKRDKIGAEIANFETITAENTERPLWIAADQEGGNVQRLSPPLPRQPSLYRLVRKAKSAGERDFAIRKFANKQAQALAGIGVNLNFAPVVDLRPKKRNKRDRHTNLILRAISPDPGIVTYAAASYCEVLANHGVLCTLKHFPGLKRIKNDTHIKQAELKTKRGELEGTDWVPFREITEATQAALMVGHPHMKDVDPDNPASVSKPVIQGIIRGDWKYDGLVVTDDLSMGAIQKRKGGMAKATIEALNAGADLALITIDADDKEVFRTYYELLQAYADGRLDRNMLKASKKRLDRFANKLLQTRKHETAKADGEPSTGTTRAAN